MNHFLPTLTIASLLIFFAGTVSADEAEKPKGIQGQKAPPLDVPTWIQVPEGKQKVEISDYEGKVVVMLFFQHWCEASQKRALPTLKHLVDKFGSNDGVAFLAVQTAFQGLADNTEDKIKIAAEEFDLAIPFGHTVKTPEFPTVNGAYQTGGTPWWVIINKEGVVEYNGHYLNPEEAETGLAEMLGL